jgi:hypothetical protein
LHVQGASGRNILLGIAIPAIAHIGREPAIKMIAVAHKESAGVGAVLIQNVATRVFGEKTRALYADFLGAALVGSGACDEHKKCSKHNCSDRSKLHSSFLPWLVLNLCDGNNEAIAQISSLMEAAPFCLRRFFFVRL